MDQLKPNCFGFLFHKTGITRQERFISPRAAATLIPKYFEETEANLASVVVMRFTGTEPALLDHAAVVDPQDASFIVHRKFTGSDVCRERRVEIWKDRPLGLFEASYYRRK